MPKTCTWPEGCTHNVFSMNLCPKHWRIMYAKPIKKVYDSGKPHAKNSKPRARKPIKKVSDKHAAELKIYYELREDFLKEYPLCQVRIKCSGAPATEIHHPEGRIGYRLTDKDSFVGSCGPCHRHITDHSAQAIEDGHSKRRNTEIKRPFYRT